MICVLKSEGHMWPEKGSEMSETVSLKLAYNIFSSHNVAGKMNHMLLCAQMQWLVIFHMNFFISRNEGY